MEYVVFNGIEYRKPIASRYFTGQGQLLHRVVWEFYRGPIPDGHHVHHKFENDTATTDPDRLECMLAAEHMRYHKLGFHHTDETKTKIGAAGLGRTHTDETRKKIKTNRKPYTPTKETREKIRVARTGQHHAPESIDKIRAYRHTDDAREQMSQKRQGKYRITNGQTERTIWPNEPIPDGWRRGRARPFKHTDDSKAQIAAALLGKPRSEADRAAMREGHRKRKIVA